METMNIETFTIDPEFKALLAPLLADEREELERNILARGCLDPLKAWQGILIDGHNRYEICTKHSLPYTVTELSFDDREDVIDWIIDNQIGRRNLTQQQASYYRGMKYDRMKKRVGRPEKCGNNFHISQPVNTAEVVAGQYGVTEKTIRNDAAYARAVDAIAETAGEEVKQQILTGELPLTKQDVAAVVKMPKKEQKALFQEASKQADGLSAIKPVLAKVRRQAKEHKRETRRAKNRQKIAALPKPQEAVAIKDVKFATIVIDPPWDWGDEGDHDQLGRARPDYATMSIEQLLKLEVASMADVDCHLYLWITNRSLPKGFQLLEAWGFRYITTLTWAKPSFGMGNYFRGQTEHILFGVKGSQPLKRKDVGTIFYAERGPNGHSSKPPQFLEMVESCSPGPYLEMFSRSERDGWVTWGEAMLGGAQQ